MGAAKVSTSGIMKLLRNPGFWLILALLVLITLPYYEETLQHPTFLTNMMSNLGLTRHTFERILYLAPIVWAGFLFGWRGSVGTSLAALALMLPRAIFISQNRTDSVFETGAVFVIGNVIAISFELLRREREHRTQLEAAHKELTASEQRYRELFENAQDAIWVHDMAGNIIAANRAAANLSGYSIDNLVHMKVADLLSAEGLELAREVRRKLLSGEAMDGSYDQRLIRKDGSEALVRLSSSLLRKDGQPVAFQHIVRDVTDEKRLQENLRFYLQQAARAQEEERKRISRELHDETIQSLVVLSRQLDALASSGEGLSEDARQRLEELRQQTNGVMKGVRRLSQDLRPAALDRLGLLPALEWLASDVSEYSGIPIKVKVLGRERRLSEEIELVLFRITQEALRNVWRHSEATEAQVTVEFSEGNTRITISDNGRGFKLPRSMGDLAKDGKLGLAGMEERARLIGGVLTAESQPGKGTSLSIELPA
jgi:two-component system sensor histidine kinase DegS